MFTMLYREEAKELFESYVTDIGQASTVQGELIRSIYRLREEASRNGNMNWDNGFISMADYLLEILSDNKVFSMEEIESVKEDIERIKDYKNVLTDDTVYDRIVDRYYAFALTIPRR